MSQRRTNRRPSFPSVLELWDEKGRLRACVQKSRDGLPYVVLCDGRGRQVTRGVVVSPSPETRRLARNALVHPHVHGRPPRTRRQRQGPGERPVSS
jgi:hypothetical protein